MGAVRLPVPVMPRALGVSAVASFFRFASYPPWREGNTSPALLPDLPHFRLLGSWHRPREDAQLSQSVCI